MFKYQSMSKSKKKPRGSGYSSRKVEKPKSSLFSRNNILIALGVLCAVGVATAERLGVTNILGKKEVQTSSVPLNPAPQTQPNLTPPFPLEKPKEIVESEWMKKTELPKSKLRPETLNWNNDQKAKHFLPDDIDRSKLPEFYKKFDQLKSELLSNLSNEQEPQKREKAIGNFLSQLSLAYYLLSGDEAQSSLVYGSYQLGLLLHKINRLLLPHDTFVTHDFCAKKGEEGPRVAIFSVDRMQMLDIEQSGKHMSIPVVFPKDQQNGLVHAHSSPLKISGQYCPSGQYIIFNKKDEKRQVLIVKKELDSRHKKMGVPIISIDIDKLVQAASKTTTDHEAAHASLAIINNIDPLSQDTIKPRGDIKIGNNSIPESDYTNAKMIHLHELYGVGIGLMNSGSSAIITAWSSADPINSYKLARIVMLLKIINSQHISNKLRTTFVQDLKNTKQVQMDNIAVAITQIPQEELHKIGESMAKLAIYLTQGK